MLDTAIINSAKNTGSITERELVGIKTLTNCGNWKRVIPIGLVDHTTRLVNYQGMLAELDSRVYFVRKETMAALDKDIKWKVTRIIKIG